MPTREEATLLRGLEGLPEMSEDKYQHFQNKGVTRYCHIHDCWYDVLTGCTKCNPHIPQEPNVKAKKPWWRRIRKASQKKLEALKSRYERKGDL